MTEDQYENSKRASSAPSVTSKEADSLKPIAKQSHDDHVLKALVRALEIVVHELECLKKANKQ